MFFIMICLRVFTLFKMIGYHFTPKTTAILPFDYYIYVYNTSLGNHMTIIDVNFNDKSRRLNRKERI